MSATIPTALSDKIKTNDLKTMARQMEILFNILPYTQLNKSGISADTLKKSEHMVEKHSLYF